jgi:hypothetical protein
MTELERAIETVQKIRTEYREKGDKHLARLHSCSEAFLVFDDAQAHLVCAEVETAMIRVLLALHESKDTGETQR